MRLRCVCGGELPAYDGNGRPRKTCDACKRRQRQGIERRRQGNGRRSAAERARYDKEAARIKRLGQKERLKADILRGYGGHCVCCGEDNPRFLTVDHVNGRGTQERREQGNTYVIWRRLRREGFPPGFQILCFNCNCGRAINGGVCPHEEQVATVLRLVA